MNTKKRATKIIKPPLNIWAALLLLALLIAGYAIYKNTAFSFKTPSGEINVTPPTASDSRPKVSTTGTASPVAYGDASKAETNTKLTPDQQNSTGNLAGAKEVTTSGIGSPVAYGNNSTAKATVENGK